MDYRCAPVRVNGVPGAKLNDMAKISDDDKRTFLEVVNENIKIIRELGLNADEVRARFGLLPLEESAPKGTWDESDLVPNPE